MAAVALAALAVVACSDGSGGNDAATGTEGGGVRLDGNGGQADAGADTLPVDASLAATIKSAAGKLTLMLPAGALPAGTKMSDVKVTAITQADLVKSALPKGVVFLGAYKLEPEGIELGKDATLTFTLDAPAKPGAPLAVVASGSAAEAVDAAFVLDKDRKITEVTATLSRFGKLGFFNETFVEAPSPYGTYKISVPLLPTIPGGKVYYGAEITPTLSGSAGNDRSPEVSGAKGSRSWSATSWWLTRAHYRTVNVKPDSPEEVGPPGSQQSGKSYATSRMFTCEQPGTMEVSATALFRIDKVVHTWGANKLTSDAHVVGAAPDTAECKKPLDDKADDYVDTVLANTPTYTNKAVDILSFTAMWLLAPPSSDAVKTTRYKALIAAFDDAKWALACGTKKGALMVVCAPKVNKMPEGDLVVFVMKLAAPVPLADTGHSFVYGAIADSDGDSGNNWRFVAPDSGDYYQGADRWYELIWDHVAKTWSVKVTQIGAQQQKTDVTDTSSVRVVVDGAMVTFYVPKSELPGLAPKYRMLAYGHDGKLSASDRGGDVTGTDGSSLLSQIQHKVKY